MVQKPIYPLATYIYANICLLCHFFSFLSCPCFLYLTPHEYTYTCVCVCMCVKSHNIVSELSEDKLHTLWPLTPKYFGVYSWEQWYFLIYRQQLSTSINSMSVFYLIYHLYSTIFWSAPIMFFIEFLQLYWGITGL